MNNRISNKDKKDWENFLSNKETLPNKDFNNSKTKNLKTLTFDLHGYSLEEANSKIDFLIKNSYENGVGKLIIVTGKGLHSTTGEDAYVSQDLSKLKFSVPEFINNNEELKKHVISISDANINDGGAGAILIKLKNL